MPTAKIIFLITNLLGGILVISSYFLGLGAKNGGADALWGATPVSIRLVYTVSMVIAALGYFLFIYYILFKLSPSSTIFKHLYIIFLGILLPSALWMPLTNLFLASQTQLLWTGVRIALAIVGISSCILAWRLYSLHFKESGLAYWLAVLGSIYFAFHTAILDMIFWPILFKR